MSWSPNYEQKSMLKDLYAGVADPLDRLPYTPAFEEIYTQLLESTAQKPERSDVWQVLTNMRKNKQLPRKAR